MLSNHILNNYNQTTIKMKITFTVVFSLLCFFAYADQDEIVLNNNHQQHDHNEYFDPADMPELYYNRVDQEIILVADGFVSSYDVNIVSLSTLQLVLHSTANGYGDTIDVSSLPNDDYVITLDPPVNVSFEGTFSVYTHQ